MVVHAVVDEGDGERGSPFIFPAAQGNAEPPAPPGGLVLGAAVARRALSPPARCFLAEHAGHSHVLLATFEKVRAGLGPSCPLPAPGGCWRELGKVPGLFWGGPEAGGLSPGAHPLVFPSPARRRHLLREAPQAEASGERAAPPGDPRGPPGCHLLILPAPLQVDGVSYLLQEIYGIENKYNTQDSKVGA